MGPNYLWHVDGYDKLKPFGMAISGCIDGFLRRIMWLKCGPANNNPEVLKNNFIDCIRLWFATHQFILLTDSNVRLSNGHNVISWCGRRQAASFASYVEISPFYKKLFRTLNYSSWTTSSQNLSAAAKIQTWLKRSNVCTAKSQALAKWCSYPESRKLQIHDMTLTLPSFLRCLWCCCVRRCSW